jgi:hypothetical protein
MSVSLVSSVESPALLGTVVVWTSSVSNGSPGTYWYRFRIGTRSIGAIQTDRAHAIHRLPFDASSPRSVSSIFRTAVDYGPSPAFTWTEIEHEGIYPVEVSVKNQDTGDVATATAFFEFTPRAGAETAAITPTVHPLVFIYSAPPCPAGSSMTVRFRATGDRLQQTPSQACDGRRTMNFYIAGLRGGAVYSAWHIVQTGGASITGVPLTFGTSTLSFDFPAVPLTAAPLPTADGILLQSTLELPAIATDLAGNPIWYGPPGLSYVTRPVTGGTFLGVYQDGTRDSSYQFFREFDFVGNTLAETNAARVSEQLVALGLHPVNSFHHEARKLQNGGYLVLAGSERILTDVQGPGPVDVIGDTIVVLDPDLQVTWAWDAFDHLDPHRTAVLGERCGFLNSGCANFYLASIANDWLHGNALALTPDGNILYSTRHQDWIVKIDYRNGAGTGDILWRLGSGGDFQISSSDASPWFSHQHDANVELDGVTLLVFDDGNTRAATDPAVHSRGQVLQLDEPNHAASLVLNADLGAYAPALGSAQRLPNGDYHFDLGFGTDSSSGASYARSLELNLSGDVVYGIEFGTIEYRSFRMRNLYTAP